MVSVEDHVSGRWSQCKIVSVDDGVSGGWCQWCQLLVNKMANFAANFLTQKDFLLLTCNLSVINTVLLLIICFYRNC